ncbi:hypothetical protein SCA03_25050 [Streptomyces cacaoi]|uniref:Heme-binding protein n=1 Tax=Streptomyces cacaoi TaxID=1898 RepID=A0A4Y3QX33_STRCI|nr:hypothetical protein SCA03_25050 [Streptomyces cacaoi]
MGAQRRAGPRCNCCAAEGSRSGWPTGSGTRRADAAAKAAHAALDAAEKAGRKVSVAVVDRNGNTVATLRGDGAGPQSCESAERKGCTAVSWNAPTSELAVRLRKAPQLKDIPGTLFLAGGAPCRRTASPLRV